MRPVLPTLAARPSNGRSHDAAALTAWHGCRVGRTGACASWPWARLRARLSNAFVW